MKVRDKLSDSTESMKVLRAFFFFFSPFARDLVDPKGPSPIYMAFLLVMSILASASGSLL